MNDAELVAQLHSLKAESERLKAALAPFATTAEQLDREVPGARDQIASFAFPFAGDEEAPIQEFPISDDATILSAMRWHDPHAVSEVIGLEMRHLRAAHAALLPSDSGEIHMTDHESEFPGGVPAAVARERARGLVQPGAVPAEGRCDHLVAEGWPMATAPKDGTAILLYGRWSAEVSCNTHDKECWNVARWEDSTNSDWYEIGEDSHRWLAAVRDVYEVWCENPICWHPLPASPERDGDRTEPAPRTPVVEPESTTP